VTVATREGASPVRRRFPEAGSATQRPCAAYQRMELPGAARLWENQLCAPAGRPRGAGAPPAHARFVMLPRDSQLRQGQVVPKNTPDCAALRDLLARYLAGEESLEDAVPRFADLFRRCFGGCRRGYATLRQTSPGFDESARAGLPRWAAPPFRHPLVERLAPGSSGLASASISSI